MKTDLPKKQGTKTNIIIEVLEAMQIMRKKQRQIDNVS